MSKEPQTSGSLHVQDEDTIAENSTTATVLKTASKTHETKLKLDELSDELDRRTKETQMLQEEVENATKQAFLNVCCTRQQMCHIPRLKVDVNSDIAFTHEQLVIQPLTHGLNELSLEVARRNFTFPGKEVLENAIDDYSQQVSELQKQIKESHDQHEQQKFHFRQVVIKLQTELHQVQMEKDFLSDLRMKDSRKHADQMERLQETLLDLQSTKRSGEQKLQQMEEEAESLESTIREAYSALIAYENCRGVDTSAGICFPGSLCQLPLGVLAAKVLEDMEQEREKLQERLSLALEKLGCEEMNHQAKAEIAQKEQHERMEQLIASHDQQVATVTDKLSASRNANANLHVKLDILQKHAESQELLYKCQVTELDSALSLQKDKACALEQQLAQVQSQVEDAQRGREHSLKQAENLESQLVQLTVALHRAGQELVQEKERCGGLQATVEELRKELEERSLLPSHLDSLVRTVKQDCQAQMEVLRCGERQRWELQRQLQSLGEQLETARQRLCRAGEEEARLLARLEDKSQEAVTSQTLLAEREELKLARQEARQGGARLEEAQERWQRRLDDGEKVVQTLRLQLESSGQATAQRGHEIGSLLQEKTKLSQQLVQHQLEVQQLKAELGQRQSSLAAAEEETRRLRASLVERRRHVQKVTGEKRELSMRLDAQRAQLLSLTEKHEALQRFHDGRRGEHEGAVLQLTAQLKSAQAELERARSTLGTLEGSEEHGLRAALGMQKQITARREQIDTLQSRIKQLEETMEKLYQEKRYQEQEREDGLQELASVREQKRQLHVEMEALRSKERQQRDVARDLEAALHKMSESFADCQNFIQLQEQEFVRLKLQHALDLKELQGQNVRSVAASAPPPALNTTPSGHPAKCPSWRQASHNKSPGLQESPALQLHSLFRELHGVISEEPGPPLDQVRVGCPRRRRSAPERVCMTTLEPRLLRTDLNENSTGSPFYYESQVYHRPLTSTSYTSAQPVGCRSPVHSLLTSNPRNKVLHDRLEAVPTQTIKPREISSFIRGYKNNTKTTDDKGSL